MQDATFWTDETGTKAQGRFSWAFEELKDAILWEIFTGMPKGTMALKVGPAGPTAVDRKFTVVPEFQPGEEVTRAQFAAVLARTTGFGEAFSGITASLFSDVALDDWFGNDVQALVEKGIIKPAEFTGGKFLPDKAITRVEIAGWIGRAAKAYGLQVAPQELKFSDTGQIAASLKDDMGVALALGIINGYPDGNFGVNDTAERAAAAAMMVRFVPHLSKNAPTVDELKQAVQESLNAFNGYERDNNVPFERVAFEDFQAAMKPYFVDGLLKAYVHPAKRGTVIELPHRPGVMASNGTLYPEPWGWNNDPSLLSSLMADRSYKHFWYQWQVVEELTPVQVFDRFAIVNVQYVVQGKMQSGGVTSQSRYEGVYHLKRDQGRWKIASMGPEDELGRTSRDRPFSKALDELLTAK